MLTEDLLVRLLARIEIEQNSIGEIKKALGSDLNWTYFFDKVQREGIAGLAYQNLSRVDSARGIVPQDIWRGLENCYYTTAASNNLLYQNFVNILTRFNQTGIKTIVLKGAFLAENIYKNLGLRAMSDFDILIKKTDLSKANEILNALGYSTPAHYRDFLENSSASSVNALMYGAPRPLDSIVHIHWHLINTTWPLDFLVAKIDMERIFSSAVPTKIDGVDSLTLAPHHLLIYLSLHSFTHSFDRLILLSEIVEVLRHYKDALSWDMVAEEAERFNLSYIMYCSLLFASQALKFEIPLLERLKPEKISFLEKIISFFIRKGIRSYKLSYPVYFSLQKGIWSKLKFIGRTIFPSSCVMAHNFRLPSSKLRPRHYCQRIIRNIFRFLSFHSW